MIVFLRSNPRLILLTLLIYTPPTSLQPSTKTNHSHHRTRPTKVNRPHHRTRSLSWWETLRYNFHIVQAGALYRCKQLSSRKLASFIKKFGIKTIVNLRGKHPEKRWWADERTVARLYRTRFYNIPMRAEAASEKKHLIKLLSIYKKAPRPILIHCHHGADRTGEAAALWKLEQEKSSKKVALRQLSWRYWHITCRFPLKRRLITHWQGIEWLKHNYHPETIAINKPNFIH